MPIKPENKHKYPPRKEWLAIVERIRKRSGDKCEWCGVKNHVVGYRDEEGEFHPNTPEYDVGRLRIVLTVAHVHNPDPADCRDENLAHLCQRCHNRHDGPMRRKNAAETREKKDAAVQPRLFNAP